MEDARTTNPKSTIPGWRVILSDKGRLWASRVLPFTDAETDVGADRTVDADTLDELRAEVDRHEAIAREAAGRVTS
ncbi:hypothetical protein [Streptosporangium sp. NPDC049046]|uniref:hypothetical protein n=1 Tax=Streptosporangium sp. NPDC049046 TaxID=3155031 RepID=UPI0034258B0E